MWIPPAQQRDHLKLRLLGGEREQHGAVQEIRRKGRTVVSALNAIESEAKISEVEEVANEELGAGLFELLRSPVALANKGANREALFQELQDRSGASAACRRGHQNLGSGHSLCPFSLLCDR